MKKRTYLILLWLLTVVMALGQSPSSFNYQAVLRDASGNVRANTGVTLTIQILQGSPAGTAVFNETHTVNTNNFGLVNLEIGSYNPAGFSAIDWANGPYFIKIVVDGTEMGTSELLSVPYALYAKEAGNGGSASCEWEKTGDNIYYRNGNVGINTTNPLSKLSINANGYDNSTIYAYNYQNNGRGLYIQTTNESSLGILARSSGRSGIGIWGSAESDSGVNTGGHFEAGGTTGMGVFGWAYNQGNTENIGGFFAANGSKGIGVKGVSHTYGGYFESYDSIGVCGLGKYYGVTGRGKTGGDFIGSGDPGINIGVSGEATSSSSSHNYAGFFTANGNEGTGVLGRTYGSSGVAIAGNAYGIYGIGVQGVASYGADGQRNYGGYFKAESVVGVGVYGKAEKSAGIGIMAYGGLVDFHASGPGTDYSPFTGAHEVKLPNDFPKTFREGLIVSTTGEVKARIDENGITSISSTLPTVILSDTPMDKSVFGAVFREVEKPKDHWNQEDFRLALVNAVGEGRVLVTNINGDVRHGDYITTSEIPGYGMKQNDDTLHNYTFGKALEDVNWEEVSETVEFNGKVYKVYLIAVVYTCG